MPARQVDAPAGRKRTVTTPSLLASPLTAHSMVMLRMVGCGVVMAPGVVELAVVGPGVGQPGGGGATGGAPRSVPSSGPTTTGTPRSSAPLPVGESHAPAIANSAAANRGTRVLVVISEATVA
jgi:hypothetical protein